jgi:hypothetical protein
VQYWLEWQRKIIREEYVEGERENEENLRFGENGHDTRRGETESDRNI